MKWTKFVGRYGLSLIIVYFFVINIFTISWMLPNIYDPTEDSHLISCDYELLKSRFTQYSPFFCNMVFLSRLPIFFLPFFPYVKESLLLVNTSLIIYHRILLILLGCAGLFFIYKTTYLITNDRKFSLLAPLLLACNPFYLRYAKHPGKPDFYLWVALIFFMYFYLNYIYNKNLNFNLVLGFSLITAVCISLKYNSAFFFIPLGFLFLKKGWLEYSASKKLQISKNYYFLFFLLVLLFGALLNLNGLNSKTISSQDNMYFGEYGDDWYNLHFTNYFKLATYSNILNALRFIYPGYIWVLIGVLSLLAAVYVKKTRVLLYSSLSALLLFSFYLLFFPRHFVIALLPLIPLSVSGLHMLKKYRTGRKALLVIIPVFIILNIAYSLDYIENFSHDSRSLAKSWIEENIEPTEIVVFDEEPFLPYFEDFYYNSKISEISNNSDFFLFIKEEQPPLVLLTKKQITNNTIDRLFWQYRLGMEGYTLKKFKEVTNLNPYWDYITNPPQYTFVIFKNRLLLNKNKPPIDNESFA